MTYNMTNRKKRRAAIIAVTCAILVALSGTFAWQSISQQALNEAKGISNPGGRLHDDYSGPDGTKDVYVENFGDQDIFARVRLDEYMEIGKGAGTKGTYSEETGWTASADNKATSLVNGANINDVTTWTTHLPGDVDANISTGDESKTQWTDSSKTFRNYFTWTMGGEGDNNGQTVYMPTFNKNKDSLAADINGTLEGKNGTAYADYVEYTKDQTVSGTVYEDADDNTVDEGANDPTKKGNGGTESVNFRAIQGQNHTAKETLTASVITMATYQSMDDEGKTAFAGWVYDADGWAYWSQPIKAGTATGLLLDEVSTKDKADEWYYGINVVAQFVTANDLGKTGENATGFFADGGQMPSSDALDLLARAGVNTKGITLTADDTNENVSGIITVVPGADGYSMSVTATAATEVTNWVWESSNTDVATVSAEGDENSVGKITVPKDAAADGSAIITVKANNNTETIGSTTFTVKVGDYEITVKDSEEKGVTAVSVPIGESGVSLTASAMAAGGTTSENGTWSWAVSGDKATSFSIESTNASAATVKAASGATAGDTATVTVTYTGTDSKTASYTFDVTATNAA